MAAETTNSEIVLIREGDVVSDDLYAAAISVRVVGEIQGDLVAIAAEQIVIEGRVTGSVTAISPSISVTGEVGGSVRAATGNFSLSGEINGDLVVTGAEVELAPESSVTGDVLAWTLRMTALGTIGGDFIGSQRRLDLAGSVGGDVDVSVGALTVVDPLTVGGDLSYRSRRDAVGLEQADVTGAVVRKTTLPPNIRIRALAVFARILAIVFLAIAAVTTVWASPDRSRSASRRVTAMPVRSWLYGALVLFSPFLVVAMAALVLNLAPPVAALPLMALAVPLTLALLGLVMVLALISGVPVSIRVGNLIGRKWGLFGAVLAGTLLLGLLWCIPLVGWLVPVMALPLGLGAWMLSRSDQPSTASS
jgi:cytoskeletal protein CcmA (bactofilin family)